MPYITKGLRRFLESTLENMVKDLKLVARDERAGTLNYVITKLIVKLYGENIRYNDIAEITGVLENVKQEYYRRVAAEYENKKCRENDDVYFDTFK